jgi:hypothetical protein
MGQVILRRYEAATGEPTVLVETDKTFEAGVADEPPRNRRLLPVTRAGAYTAEVRGSNPLS